MRGGTTTARACGGDVTMRAGLALCLLLSTSCATGVAADEREPVTIGCASNPFKCPERTTCSLGRTGAFECLRSDSMAKLGDPCDMRPGTPTCGDGMLCYQPTPPDPGECVPFCGFGTGGHDCEAGAVCKTLQYPGSAQVHACVGVGGGR